VSRYYEHQADQYGLEVIHGLVPDVQLSAAQAFQILGERSLDYPYVGKLAEFWAWDHPTIRDRMIFVQTYDPWGEGKQPEFVRGSPAGSEPTSQNNAAQAPVRNGQPTPLRAVTASDLR